ncbi:EhaF family protein [Methanospirillum hungatei]|uniref:EhaF family protein n=1 Tax=Methanospirillum hungatei TaxID=2203 RepID=UPI0026EF079D|nr:EhaF family protein [Methanospirillum hungatei]MCA1916079.1 EhaF family protein [Methanospirillum hungatei]
MIRRIGKGFRIFSNWMSTYENLVAVYAALGILVALCGVLMVPMLTYHEDQIYSKTIHRDSTLDPYDRGGIPFTRAEVKAQYPANSPTVGFVTAYLTPLSWFLANSTPYLGTTIVAHPGGILDEILYNTRGLDTVVETSILFTAFAIASFLFRRRD